MQTLQTTTISETDDLPKKMMQYMIFLTQNDYLIVRRAF
jgi:hypothetical protein